MDRPWTSALMCIGLVGLLAGSVPMAMAARKYYPKGFTPPSDAQLLPGKSTSEKPESDPTGEGESSSLTLIKTIAVPVPAKPKDEITELLEAQRLSEALRLVEQRQEDRPGDMSLKLLHAYIQREKENFEASESEYRWVAGHTSFKPIQAKAYSGLGWTQLSHAGQAKRLGDAIAHEELLHQADLSFQQSLKRDKREHTAWTGVAKLHLNRQKPDEAERALTRAAALAPNDTQLLLTRGQYHILNNTPDAALPFLFKAKQQEALKPEVYLLLAQAYFAMNRVDDGMIQLQHLLEQDPSHNEALKLLSEAYANKMKPADAEAALQKAIFLNPSDVDAVMTLLQIYDASSAPERSIPLLEQLMSLQPKQGRYAEALIQRLAQAHRWEDVYQKGLTLLEGPWTDLSASPAANPALGLFLQSVYIHDKNRLHREAAGTPDPLSRLREKLTHEAAQHPEDFNLKLGMLFLDPTTTVSGISPVPEQNPEAWPLRIKMAYLQGDNLTHQKLVHLETQNPAYSMKSRLALSEDLLSLGDYAGAQAMATSVPKNDADATNIQDLQERIATAHQQAETQLRGLLMLPAHVPAAYWEQNAEDALKWASGNWQLHAALADSLWNRRDYPLALTQQKLAAQYAPNTREKIRWLKKIQRTQELLNRQQSRQPSMDPSYLTAKQEK